MNDEVSQNPQPEGEPSAAGDNPQNQYQAPQPPPAGWYYVPPQPVMNGVQNGRRLKYLIPLSLAVGCLPWLILGVLLVVAIIIGAGETSKEKHVAIIRVSGVITGGNSDSGVFNSSTSGSEDIIRQLEKARKDDNAKSIVIRINSPGGSPAGSEEVYNEIMRIRKSGKPVYASMGDVAASGGYYIASACDKIYAGATSLTGSIGVIFQTTDMSGLFKKVGVNPQTITSGKFKDTGSSARPLTAEDRVLLKGIVENIYGEFVQAVADGRNIPLDQVKKLADGRVFTGSQALKAKLIDKIGGLHETTRAAAKAAGIKGEPSVVEYEDKGLLSTFFGSDSESASSRVERDISKEILGRLLRRNDMLQNIR